ncbi:hypothetical protein F183_A11240 [Bryobacterales bacterium F-183]|nr:hypothetical protein F183_A11240 [Bryobacterales bacterium F-183]
MPRLPLDLRYAFRTLKASPGFSLAVMLALGLAIGTSTAMYAVVHAVLLDPLAYRDPQRLVAILQDSQFAVAPANFLDLRAASQPLFTDIAAAEVWNPRFEPSSAPEAHPDRVPAVRVTPNLFPLLGVAPIAGRTLSTGADGEVVLSYALWQKRFGGAPGVVGRTLRLDGQTYTITGIMPQSFVFSPFWAKGDLWVRLPLERRLADRKGSSLRLFARLRDNITLDQARTQVAKHSQQLRDLHPQDNRELALVPVPLADKVVGDVRPLLRALASAAALLLLIACANVANLLLARATARRQEVAIRTALGGSAWTIARQYLTESLLLALGGATFGLALSAVLLPFARLATDVPRIANATMNWQAILFCLALAVATGLAFGTVPALVATRMHRLQVSTRGGSLPGGRLRSALVVAEVALSMMLAVGAGLAAQSFVRLAAADPGFRVAGTLSLQVQIAQSRAERLLAVQNKLRDLPGVTDVSAINHVPLAGDVWGVGFQTEGDTQRNRAVYRVVEPGYFQTMALALQPGSRDFHLRDTLQAPQVAIINEALAKSAFPQGDAIGKRLTLSEPGSPTPIVWRTIVGVVANARQRDWRSAPDPEIYLPFRQSDDYLQSAAQHFATMTLVVHTQDHNPASLTEPARQAVWTIDPTASISNITTLQAEKDRQLWRPRFAMWIATAFGTLALILAALGIYAVVAYAVSLRSREMGIRLALGASQASVKGMIIGQGIKLVGWGIAIGLAASLAAGRILQSILYEVSARDAWTFSASALLFLAVAIAASYLPARRAAGTDPAMVLRGE